MRYLAITLLLFISSHFLSQNTPDSIQNEFLTIGIGPQMNSFHGDIGAFSVNKIFTNTRPCFSLDIEKRLGKIIGLQLMFVKGKISDNYRSAIMEENKNFESNIFKTNFNIILNTDNYLKNKGNFSPYLALGGGFLMFDSYSDLKDANGNLYNYWSDGTIRDISENDSLSNTASFLYRDYDYETSLSNDSVNYDNFTFLLPVTVGFKWKVNPYLQGRVYTTYNTLLTDWIDNVSNQKNDFYFSLGFTMNYAIHKIVRVKKEKIDVDLEAFNLLDEDGDGIIDLNDKCHHTPKNVEVDHNGCPTDNDKDGVPDYLDKEPNSKYILHVDEEGRSLTDSLIYYRTHQEDSIEVERNQTFSDSTENDEMNFIPPLEQYNNTNSFNPVFENLKSEFNYSYFDWFTRKEKTTVII